MYMFLESYHLYSLYPDRILSLSLLLRSVRVDGKSTKYIMFSYLDPTHNIPVNELSCTSDVWFS